MASINDMVIITLIVGVLAFVGAVIPYVNATFGLSYSTFGLSQNTPVSQVSPTGAYVAISSILSVVFWTINTVWWLNLFLRYFA